MRPLAIATVVVLAAALAACGEESGTDAEDAAVSASPPASAAPMPTSAPAASGPVRTDGLVTVLDEGEPELCLGAVARSLPPQCEGLPLAGWRWADHPQHERRGRGDDAVRWGSFALTGTWDGSAFTATEAIPAALYDVPSAPPEPGPGTPCEQPADGWRVVDPDRTTPADLDAVLNQAARLDGYAESWLDGDGVDPEGTVVNVRVTGDVATAEEALRETWGGPLCVTQAQYTEAELTALANELQALPGVLTSAAAGDVVEVTVVHDDGTLQDWADGAYGEGRVAVRSALMPVEG